MRYLARIFTEIYRISTASVARLARGKLSVLAVCMSYDVCFVALSIRVLPQFAIAQRQITTPTTVSRHLKIYGNDVRGVVAVPTIAARMSALDAHWGAPRMRIARSRIRS